MFSSGMVLDFIYSKPKKKSDRKQFAGEVENKSFPITTQKKTEKNIYSTVQTFGVT